MTSSRTARALRPIALALSLGAAAATLSACAPLIIGGAAAGGALVATDRRTTGVQVEDKNIGLKVESQLRQQLGETSRINATSYLSRVLLTGEAPDQAAKDRATQIAQGVENVKEVVNQIRVAPVSSLEDRTSDTWITSKVRTALINTRGVPSRTMTITTSAGVVYLMGKVTRIEGDMAAAAAADVSGVKQVVKVFHIMTREEEEALARDMAASGATNGAPASSAPITSPAGSGNAAGSGVEIIPIE